MASEDRGGGTAALPDLRALHQRAAQRFVEVVECIRPDQWELSTPCSEWTVRQLVDHVVRWSALVPEFMGGLSLKEMDAPLERDILGKDPIGTARDSARAAIDAFDAPGAMECVVHHPFGEYPAVHFLYLRLFDNAVHGWDLARALGLHATIDPDIGEVLYAGALPQREAIRASGQFGVAEVPVLGGADTATRLLGLIGRKP